MVDTAKFKSTKIKMSRSDKIYSAVCNIFLILSLLIVLIPLLNVIASSFSSPTAVLSGSVFILPVEFTLIAYEAVFNSQSIVTGFTNSLIYMVVGTIINLIVTVAYSYPLSVKSFYGRRPLMLLLTFTMYFSGGLIPSYLVVSGLGMVDTMWALVVPGAVSVYQIIVCRTFFQTSIPAELYEAATIDGCGDIKYLVSILLPNAKAILAVMTLMFAVSHWNTFFSALIYISDTDKYPLQLVLRDILLVGSGQSEMMNGMDIEDQIMRQNMSELLKYSTIVVASAPMMILYPFVQKYFVKGVMVGSLKG